MRKPRSRRSGRPLLYGVVIALLLLSVPVIYIKYRLDLRPLTDATAPQQFVVAKGENAQRIATHLKSANLIRNRNAFITYVNFHGLRPRLKVGTYTVSANLSAAQIATLLADGKTISQRLVVPEGYTLRQIKATVASKGIDSDAFTAALLAPHSQSFLTGKPGNVDLEGYLFPDSYTIGVDTTPAQLVNTMLDNFGRRVGPEYAQAFAAEGLTLHQGLTLASVVEKEVRIPADRPIVAQIFLKRFKTGMPLGSDVTAQYAADQLGVPFSVDIDSHYNTRRYPGLPPGPICNPGLGSLDAVAHPATTDYLYFLSGKDGKTYYAKTYAEHQANITKYLQ